MDELLLGKVVHAVGDLQTHDSQSLPDVNFLQRRRDSEMSNSSKPSMADLGHFQQTYMGYAEFSHGMRARDPKLDAVIVM